jgi:hypothetical protein
MMASKGYYYNKKETTSNSSNNNNSNRNGQTATTTTPATAVSNNSSNNSSRLISLKTIKVDVDKALTARTVGYDFLNPSEDFIGVIECISDIRHIAKRGEMKQDLDVVDIKVIEAVETREREESLDMNRKVTVTEQVHYENQYFSLVLTKAVLLSKFKALQEQYKTLVGKKVVIVGLGKAEGKQYLDYYVDTYENAVKEGVIVVEAREK